MTTQQFQRPFVISAVSLLAKLQPLKPFDFEGKETKTESPTIFVVAPIFIVINVQSFEEKSS